LYYTEEYWISVSLEIVWQSFNYGSESQEDIGSGIGIRIGV